MAQTHEPGDEVKTSGEYTPVDDDGKRTGGPIPLESGDQFPSLTGGATGWQKVQNDQR
jgi:hypothetical protein